MFVPFEDPLADSDSDLNTGNGAGAGAGPRRRCMQLILDEIHGLQKVWEVEGQVEWASAGIINSSKVLIVTGTETAVHTVIERCQDLNLANPVMDVHMP